MGIGDGDKGEAGEGTDKKLKIIKLVRLGPTVGPIAKTYHLPLGALRSVKAVVRQRCSIDCKK